jgi:hypothetical protein
MGVVELVANVFEVAVTVVGVLVLICFALAALEALIELTAQIASRRRDPEETTEFPPPPILRPRPALTLLVRHDKAEGVLRPSVQVHCGVQSPGSIRLELADEHERLRLSVCRSFPAEAVARELSFPAFAPPGGASAEEALGWHWDVVLQVGGGEPFRWREHPRPMEGMNAEAELECPVA